MKNFFNLKLFLSLFVLFIIQKMKPLYTFFYSCSQTRSLWSKLQELLNSEILLPQNKQQSAFFRFPDSKKHFCITAMVYQYRTTAGYKMLCL